MKTDIVVLGIHDGYNAGATRIKNGFVSAAIQEERLNNLKNYCRVPIFAIAGLINTYLSLKEQPMHVQLYERYARLFSSPYTSSLLVNFLRKRRNMDELSKIINRLNLENVETQFIEHHKAHAA